MKEWRRIVQQLQQLLFFRFLLVEDEFMRGRYDSQVMNLSCQGSPGLLAPAGFIQIEKKQIDVWFNAKGLLEG